MLSIPPETYAGTRSVPSLLSTSMMPSSTMSMPAVHASSPNDTPSLPNRTYRGVSSYTRAFNSEMSDALSSTVPDSSPICATASARSDSVCVACSDTAATAASVSAREVISDAMSSAFVSMRDESLSASDPVHDCVAAASPPMVTLAPLMSIESAFPSSFES